MFENFYDALNPVVGFLPKIPLLVFYLLLGYAGIQITVWVLEKVISLTGLPKLKGILLSLTKFALWVVLIILISNVFGFNRLAVAISGTALVLVFFLNTGLGPIITDAISGVFLCGDSDFATGSRVRIGKAENATEGRIKEIDMRKVRLVSDDGNVHVIPNSVVDKEEWTVIEKTESPLAKKAAVAKAVLREKISTAKVKNS